MRCSARREIHSLGAVNGSSGQCNPWLFTALFEGNHKGLMKQGPVTFYGQQASVNQGLTSATTRLLKLGSLRNPAPGRG